MTNHVKSAEGILPYQWIESAVESSVIQSDVPVHRAQLQPNSLDLRLSALGYRTSCSFLPGREGIEAKLAKHAWYKVDVSHDEGLVLEPNQVYIFRLSERLNLPDGIFATANPKSTTGRLDVFVRVFGERGVFFDRVPAGYQGDLFIEVVSRTFPLRIRPGDALAQLRFHRGLAELSDAALMKEIDTHGIIYREPMTSLPSDEVIVDSGVYLSIRAQGQGQNRVIGYRARKHVPPIDYRRRGAAPVPQYWDLILESEDRSFVLEPDEFYIFSSCERLSLPPHVCAEMVPFDAASGEFRSHYAGFFDSGFGYDPNQAPGRIASAVVLEVRIRDVPFLIEHGQPLFRLKFLRNTETPDVLYGSSGTSSYQGQGLRLAKQFMLPPPDGS